MIKRSFFAIIMLCYIVSITSAQSTHADLITSFLGQQVTGVTVSDKGKIYVNFPRWRPTVKYSVAEVGKKGEAIPFPDQRWNSWKPGQPISDSMFVAVQSVVAFGNKLYVDDTRNPLWQGVVDAPRIYVFDLQTRKLVDVLKLSEGSYKPTSYTNDLRVDQKRNAIYITDSNAAALIVYDMKKHSSRRVLDGHYSTSADADHLTIDGKRSGNRPTHADGIAFNIKKGRLYYHALTGHTLYSVSADLLVNGSETAIERDVKKEKTTPAPDGMIFDKKGNLYMADLEKHAIVYLTPTGEMKTLVEGQEIGWADTFSIYGNKLYFTNSRIHEAHGDISQMKFPLFTINLPE